MTHRHTPGKARTNQNPAQSYIETQNQSPNPTFQIMAFQIMTSPVIFVTMDTPFIDVWRTFELNGVHNMPIATSDRKILGMISERDMIQVALDLERTRYLPVGTFDWMKKAILTATPGTPVDLITHVLLDQSKDAIPIVSHDGLLEGIITRTDLLIAYSRNPSLRAQA